MPLLVFTFPKHWSWKERKTIVSVDPSDLAESRNFSGGWRWDISFPWNWKKPRAWAPGSWKVPFFLLLVMSPFGLSFFWGGMYILMYTFYRSLRSLEIRLTCS